jgi:beta-1,4-mannosyl-glycoprotein beta-1,4-N-acetylglucosaminyltransferase
MKIYDCFQFFDEEMLLDLRLNVMDKYVNKFVITEATYTHNGKPKKLIFDINNFKKFKDKIIYIVVDTQPPDLYEILDSDNDEKDTRGQKLVLNGYKRDNYQRQMAQQALKGLDPEDWIIINDIDEIPNLKKIDFKNIKNKLVLFKQRMFYYKFNLLYPSIPWFGSKTCKKKNFLSPQWLKNIRQKKYPIWRFDTLFSTKKYIDVLIVDDGGWHFTNIKSPEEIEKKLLNYTHHYEFELSGLKLKDLKKIVKEKKIIYDHSQDQTGYKWGSVTTLSTVGLSEMPDYLRDNYKKYNNWLDT